MITALCGGVGGSKLVLGLYRSLPPDTLTVIVNTADDLSLAGLHISPDLDTVTYTLAGIAGPGGWGVRDDTFQALEMLGRYSIPTWFRLGDRDLATHIVRTDLLRKGQTLSAATARISRSLEIDARILPMTDDSVATLLRAGNEWLPFQEYFVHRRYQVPIDEVVYRGAEAAQPAHGVVAALSDSEAVIVVNSNPVLSILPILAVPGIRDALERASSPRVAVSPIIGADAVSGPAGDLMRLIGQPSTAAGVAGAYRGVIDGLVIDRQDAELQGAIAAAGIRVLCTDTIMRTVEDRARLAGETLAFAQSLR